MNLSTSQEIIENFQDCEFSFHYRNLSKKLHIDKNKIKLMSETGEKDFMQTNTLGLFDKHV